MAENRITIKFRGQGAEKLRQQIDSLAKSQDKLNQQHGKFNDTTKKGSKGLRILGGSIATARSAMLLYSFAVGAAITKMIGLVREAGKFEAVSSGFVNLGEAAGFTSESIDKLRAATKNTVSDMELMKQANNALILGVSKNADEMANLFDAATRLGAALGRDTKDSVESLVTGIGRQSRLMLDNLGIIVKSEEAYERYANKLKISTKELTNHQKKLAFAEEAMTKISEAVDRLGDDFLTNEQKIAKAAAMFENLKVVLGAGLAPVVGDASDYWAEFFGGIDTGNQILSKGSHTLLELEERARKFSELGDFAWKRYNEGLEVGLESALAFDDALAIVNIQLQFFREFAANHPKDSLFNPKNLGSIRGEWEGIAYAIKKVGETPMMASDTFFEDRLKVGNMLIGQISSSLASAVTSGQNLGDAVVNSLKAIAAQIASKMLLYSLAGVFMPSLFGGSALRFGLGLAPVAHKGGHIKEDGSVQRFATGGMVKGQDNVPILAQAGEFVMSRNAVNSVGVEAMNRINAGGGSGSVSINFTGNVMSQDFIEDEAIPMIKEAIRRGADIGVA